MEDQIVTFETAKLAKEKGFLDLNMYGEIRLSQKHYYDINGVLHNIREVFDPKDYDLKDCCNAPTQGLLQKWLRDVHDLHIMIGICEDEWIVQIVEIRLEKSEYIPKFDSYYSNYSSYEDALEAGLDAALKSI